MVDWDDIGVKIATLYNIVETLEKTFPGRPFTPDGHLVGSLGEVMAAAMFNLELQPPSQKGFDAIGHDINGDQIRVEIKFTQRKNVSFNHDPHDVHVIVLALSKKTKEPYCVYNGPGSILSEHLSSRRKNGQKTISVTKLKKAQDLVVSSNKLQLPEKQRFSVPFSKVVADSELMISKVAMIRIEL
jgi:hypothetical protein